MFRRLLYTSHAAEGIGPRHVYDIIRTAQNRNLRSDLTGGLLFINGCFYQMLEGLPVAVEERYARISQDPRHHSVTLRHDAPVEDLLFPNDWMALRESSQIDQAVLASHGVSDETAPEELKDDQLVDFMLACFNKQPVTA